MEIATAFVTIRPETSGFESELASALGGADPVDVPVGADVEEAQGDIDSLTGEPVEVEVGAETGAAASEMGAFMADYFNLDVEVGAVVDPAQAEIDSLDGGEVEVKVKADTAQAQSNIDDLSGAMGKLADSAGLGGGALGGFTDSLTNLTGLSSSAAVGIGALVGGLVLSVDAAAEAEAVNAKLAQILETTGAGAFITQGAINSLSAEIMDYSGQSDEAINSAATMLLTFSGLSNEAAIQSGIFERSVKATADVAALMGGDASGAAIRLGRALDNPATGMTALQRSGVSFTESQKATIQSLAESGDMLGAQAELLSVVESQVGGVAEAYGGTLAGALDKTKQQWGENAEAIGGVFLPALNGLLGGLADVTSAAYDFGYALGEGWQGRDMQGPTEFIRGVGTVVGGLPPAFVAAAEASGDLAAAAEDAGFAVSDLDAATRGYLDGVFRVPEAQRAMTAAFEGLTAVLDDPARAASDVAVNLQGVVERAAALGVATGDMTGAVDTATYALAVLQSQGKLSAAQVAEVTSQLESIPGNTEGRVAAPGAETARSQAQRVADALMGIPGDYVANIRVNTGRLYADIAGAAAQLRSLRDIESAGRDLGTSSASTVAPTRITLVNQLDGQVLTERVFEIDRRAAMAEGYEPA